MLRGTQGKSQRGEVGRNLLRLALGDVLREDNRFRRDDAYNLERRRAISPCCTSADGPVLAITQLHANRCPLPRSEQPRLSTHVIDEGAHARKKYDARPPVLLGCSDDHVLEASSLQLERGISWAAPGEMERGRGYLEFFGVYDAAERLEGLDGAHAMSVCSTRWLLNRGWSR